MATRLVGIFDDRSSAERAQQDLLAAGFSQNNLRLVAGPQNAQSGRTTHDESWWDSIKDFFGFSDDQHASYYREAARRGSTLLTVDTRDDQVDAAAAILDRYGSVDLDQRMQQWRSEGWQGHQSTTATTATAATSGRAAARTGSEEAAIPVVEEELHVGKRAVQRGGVRVHTFVEERPVEEQVSLREEKVRVERRPVNRPVSGAEEAFKERVIEARESGEEAVVSKTARVVEEVVVDKQATERTETVRDTVRRTDVEVEKTDPRDAGASTGSTTTGRTGAKRRD